MIDFKTVCLRVMIHIIVATKWVLCISGKWVFHADGVSFYPWLFNKSTVPCCLDSVDLWWRCIYGKLISVQWFQLSLMAVNGHSYSNTFHNIYLYCIWVRHLTLIACLWHIFCSWIYILLWYPDSDPPQLNGKLIWGLLIWVCISFCLYFIWYHWAVMTPFMLSHDVEFGITLNINVSCVILFNSI